MTFYKVTDTDGHSFHGGSGKWTRNRWRSVRGDLVACENGLHLARRQDLVTWLGPVIWEAEYEGELIEGDDKVVVRRARVVRRLDTWNERAARLFAADCAERVLPIFEKQNPDDDRPRKAIEAARAFANGQISQEELAAASDAARAAARAATRAATSAAAWAAWDAAWAAWDAAWAAARDAARSAAWDAARAEFQAFATDRLFDYLEGRAG